jgi:anti-sigma factor RsiW
LNVVANKILNPMNDHPIESLPAFVLGALDADEAFQVADHVRSCVRCRAEADEFRAVVTVLPYAAESRQPPLHIKRQLFARIAATRDDPAPAHPQRGQVRPSRARTPTPGWARAVLALATVLVLALAFVTVDTRRQLDQVAAELAQSRQQVAEAQAQLALGQQRLDALANENRQAVMFIAAPATVGQTLVPQRDGIEGKMYMQPGHNRVVLVLNGLPPPPAGTTYQFWFATSDHQVPSRTFSVGPDGAVEVVIDAPEPVDDYAQVMVTVEQTGGSTSPSNQVVVSAEL